VMLQWDRYNAEELKVLRQVKYWMSDRPGRFEAIPHDFIATFLRGYSDLANWTDETYARLDAMLDWRATEKVDTMLVAADDVALLQSPKRAVFEKAFVCGPIGIDKDGHAVCLETPGASGEAMRDMLEKLNDATFLRCQTYNKEVLRRYVASLNIKAEKRMYKVVNVIDLKGFKLSYITGEPMRWFKMYAKCFGDNYPETMLRTYVVNAPMIVTGAWKVIRLLIHPVTAAKISIISWGHEKVMKKDGIELFGKSFESSMISWRDIAAKLDAEGLDPAVLAKGYAPPEDLAALQAL